MKLKIIDNNTGTAPDINRIVQSEGWASDITLFDIDGFFLSEDGQLVLADNYGNIAIVPEDRFAVEIDATGNPFPKKDKYGLTVYTDKVDDFQIRSANYLGDRPADDWKRFDIIKWEHHEPMKVYSVDERKEIVSTESCCSVGTLMWDEKEGCFTLCSIGMRLFESHPSKAVIDMVLKFADIQRKRFLRQWRAKR